MTSYNPGSDTEDTPNNTYQIENARLIGRKYNIRLAYLVEYDLSLLAGPTENQAVEEAKLARLAENVTPTEQDLIHTDVETTEDVFEDDPRAHDIADWIDAPSAPSENTYWDDTRHFDDQYVNTEGSDG